MMRSEILRSSFDMESKMKVRSLWSGKYFGYMTMAIIMALQVGLIFYFYSSENLFKSEPSPEWSSWELQMSCTVSCGHGKRIRLRKCLGETVDVSCPGESLAIDPCEKDPCSLDGGWSNWEKSGSCSVTCGKGEQSEKRSCSNPTPKGEGRQCVGDASRTISCTQQQCPDVPIDGGWSAWNASLECSRSCGSNATREEHRTCTNPSPINGGKQCLGDETRVAECVLQACPAPVDGGWSTWSTFTQCSASCGDGVEIQTRSCNNPQPANGGQDCIGENMRNTNCTQDHCTGWGPWVNISDCSVTCGNGSYSQLRECQSNLLHIHCRGPIMQEIQCSHPLCPVDGGWSEWIELSACPVSCGGGEVPAQRICNNPEPAFNGLECQGDTTATIECNMQDCTQITELVVPAGDECVTTGPDHVHGYACAFPFFHNGEERQDCILLENSQSAMCPVQVEIPSRKPVEEQWGSCDTKKCPVAGGWNTWSPINRCSVSCNGGVMTERRSCLNPPPLNGGRDCEGENERLTPCNQRECLPQPCMTVSGGPIENTQCILPFAVDGIFHNDCTFQGKNEPWCATVQTMQDGTLISNYWGYCSRQNCPIEGGWGYVPSAAVCPCSHPNSTLVQTQRCQDPAALNLGSCSGQPESRLFACGEECLNTNCGGQLGGDRGTVTSPDHPNMYPDNAWCEWTIIVEEGKRVMITFEALVMEQDYDFINIHFLEEGSKEFTGPIDVSNIGVFISARNTLRITLQSDGSVGDSGFRAIYNAV